MVVSFTKIAESTSSDDIGVVEGCYNVYENKSVRFESRPLQGKSDKLSDYLIGTRSTTL